MLARCRAAQLSSKSCSMQQAMRSILFLAALATGWAVPAALTQSEIEQEVDAMPDAPDFGAFFPPLAQLGRRLRCAAPCTGIHGCGEAFRHMKVGVDTCHIFDLEPGYARYLRQTLLDSGMAVQDIVLNLGKKVGNLLNMPLSALRPPLDLLVAGPPCPPWSGQGLRGAMSDVRAAVFLKVLEWVVCCIKCCGLIACVLENVVGITWEADGKPPVIWWWLDVLGRVCPEFTWAIRKVELVKYMSPQTRVRIFLVGFRSQVGALPDVLPPFGPASLRSILGKFPPTRSQLCSNQAVNLGAYEQKIKEMFQQGKLKLEDVVVISVDRATGKVYDQQMVANKFGTLTTNSSCLMVLDVKGVVEDVPDGEREFMRHVRESEKLVAQGFSKNTHLLLDTRCARKAAGNAYPVNLMVAVLQPIIQMLTPEKFPFDFAAWPPASLLEPHSAGVATARAAAKELKKTPPGKKRVQNGRNSKRKKAEAAATFKRKKRKQACR